MNSLTPQDLQLLMETGYLACSRGYLAEAETIFNGLAALRPGNSYPLIGKAVAQMSAGQHLDAAHLLRTQVLEPNPNHALARAFLGLALKLACRGHESQRELGQAAQQHDDPVAADMARALLADVN